MLRKLRSNKSIKEAGRWGIATVYGMLCCVFTILIVARWGTQHVFSEQLHRLYFYFFNGCLIYAIVAGATTIALLFSKKLENILCEFKMTNVWQVALFGLITLALIEFFTETRVIPPRLYAFVIITVGIGLLISRLTETTFRSNDGKPSNLFSVTVYAGIACWLLYCITVVISHMVIAETAARISIAELFFLLLPMGMATASITLAGYHAKLFSIFSNQHIDNVNIFMVCWFLLIACWVAFLQTSPTGTSLDAVERLITTMLMIVAAAIHWFTFLRLEMKKLAYPQ